LMIPLLARIGMLKILRRPSARDVMTGRGNSYIV
jgi:hypothetical protein